MIYCKKLQIFFKFLNKIENKFFNLFPQIKKGEDYIAINVRRGEKLEMSNYLIVPENVYHQIITNNLNKKIIFVSDDIQWCKKNFSQYNNVLFNDYNKNDKIIIDQFILFNSSTLVLNLDCTFSHVPILLENHKIKNLIILIKEDTKEDELNNKNSRSNIIKNNLINNIEVIGV